MILKFNNQWLEYDKQTFCNFAEPVRYVYTGANVTAIPTSGIYDTNVDLTHTTPQGYDFVEYSATGANIVNNTFTIGDTDVYVEGVFTEHYYTINTSSSHGTITANHNTAKHGTTITLSNSPATGYDFDYYEVVGATLINTNQFVVGYSDVTVIGHFKQHKYTVTVQSTNGSVTASPSEGVHGTTVTLSNTPDAGFVFNNYSLTGATLKNSNQFDIVYSDVHVIGNFVGDQYNPLNLPPYTFRFQFADTSYNPNSGSWKSGATWTRVSSNPNVWDYHRESNNYTNEFVERFKVTNTKCLGGNTTGITYMGGLFADNDKFIETAVFDTSNVTDMSSMFNDTAIAAVPLFNTSNVTNMFQFCFRCNNLTNVAQLNTSKATNTSGMFYECTSLQTIPLIDTSKSQNMEQMFRRCTALTSVPSLNTSASQNTSGMFAECSALTTIPSLNLSNVTNASRMFQDCTALTTLPNLNLSKCTNMHQFCAMDTSLTAIPTITVGKVTDCAGAFWYCYNLTGGITAMYNRFAAQSTIPAEHTQTFYYAGYSTTTGNAEWSNLPSDWK